ncbi:MAG: hypothetical protein HYY16_00830 [Planctomycetes bacterium]|nr:hypothetical protein [Planctomycetota bacterium]
MLGRSLAGLTLLALFTVPLAAAQDEYNDEIRALLDEGIKLYKQGKVEEAYGKFETPSRRSPRANWSTRSWKESAGMSSLA